MPGSEAWLTPGQFKLPVLLESSSGWNRFVGPLSSMSWSSKSGPTPFGSASTCEMAIQSASDEMHVTERYTPTSADHLMYEATIEDPKVFTRPWKISFPLYRRMEKNVQLLEFKCVPFTEELLFGKFRKQAAR